MTAPTFDPIPPASSWVISHNGRVVETFDQTMTEKAECRGCGRQLEGEPFHTGKPAWIMNHRRYGLIRAPACHYGGHVCSERCDRKACLELEGSMPGCSNTGRLMGNLGAKISRKWDALRREYPNAVIG